MNLSRKKISEIFGLLTDVELNKLRDYLSSPYLVNVKDQAIFLRLLDVIMQDALETEVAEVGEEQLFATLYPGESFVSGRIDKKISQLTTATLAFLGLEETRKGHALELGALRALRAKGVTKLYLKEFNKVKRKFLKSRSKLVDAELASFQIDLEECRFLNLDPAQNIQSSYDNLYHSLDNLYITYYIYLGIRNLTYNSFMEPKELRSKFDTLLYLMDKKNATQKLETQIYDEKIFLILANATSVQSQQIEELAAELENIKDELNIEAYKNYRTIIRSFTVVQYNSGDLSLGPVLFQLYKKEVEKESIFFASKIPSAMVNNIAIVAIREKEINWLDQFLNEIEGRVLETNFEGFTIALNRGKLFFAQKKFQEVLDILVFDVKEFYFKVYARILELMAYFELNVEQLPYKIDAYKIFIYRLPKNKIGKDFIAGHHNFIRILRSICHTNTQFDLNRICRLKEKIQETKILAEKQWLLEKVVELEIRNG